MKNSIEISVILPSYLEEENLRVLLPRLNDTMTKLVVNYEILVIDTQEPLDKTKIVCTENHVLYFNRQDGNTFGDAVRTGVKFAKGKYILFMDADGSHPPEFIPELLEHRQENDIVIASRYVEGGYTDNKGVLVMMSKLLNKIYSLVLNIKCKDISNSFKIYNGDMLRSLNLYSYNFDIVEEILYKISKNNKQIKILEVPFSFKKRMFGETKRSLISFVFTYLFTLVRLRFGK